MDHNTKGHELFAMGQFPEAVACWERASRLGNADAQFSLAYCLIYGTGVGVDAVRAQELLSAAHRTLSPPRKAD